MLFAGYITESGAIIEPLVVTHANFILSGHSRHKIASELVAQGDTRFEYVPVRYIENDLTETKVERRVILLNLNRFEIDADSRLYFRARVYPDYYRPKELPKTRKNNDEVNTASKIAKRAQLSERQIKNERMIYQEAKKAFHSDDDGEPTPSELNAIRDKVNRTRRSRKKVKPVTAKTTPNRESSTKEPTESRYNYGINLESFDSKCIPVERIIDLLGPYCDLLTDEEHVNAVVGFVRRIARTTP